MRTKGDSGKVGQGALLSLVVSLVTWSCAADKAGDEVGQDAADSFSDSGSLDGSTDFDLAPDWLSNTDAEQDSGADLGHCVRMSSLAATSKSRIKAESRQALLPR